MNSSDFKHSIRHSIQRIWDDDNIKCVYARQNEYHIIDSAPYFFDHLDRIFSENYEPTHQDILRSRLKTNGIIETDFEIESNLFKIIDVGGQRGERKKWIHTFDNVTTILFIASLSEYDQVLYEDRTKNRMEESLQLFEGICKLPWFKNTPIILFLNKQDLFIVYYYFVFLKLFSLGKDNAS